MRLLICCFTLSLLFIACNDNSNKPEKIKPEEFVKPSPAEHPLPENDTLIVDKQAAVFVTPDSIQVERRKKQVGEEDFYVGADDYAYYLNEAYKYFDSTKILTLDTKGRRYVKFVHQDKTQELVFTDTLPDLWNIYLFDPTKNAQAIDMTGLEDEYKAYFKK